MAPLTFDSQEESERAIASFTTKRDFLKRLINEKRSQIQRSQQQQKYLKEEHVSAKARLDIAKQHHSSVSSRFREETIQSFVREERKNLLNQLKQ